MIGYIKELPCHEKTNHCKAPINDLDHKFDKDVCSLSYKITKHISDTDVHVTKENKDAWDNKVDQTLIDTINSNISSISNDILDFKNEIGNIDRIVKKGDIVDMATKDYVRGCISTLPYQLDLATKTYVLLYVTGYIDKLNYYTKLQIDTLIGNGGSDYSISSIDYSKGVLTLNQAGIKNTKSVFISGSSSLLMSQEEFDDMLKQSNAIHTLTCKNKQYNPIISDCDISSYLNASASGESSAGYYKPYFKNSTNYDSMPISEMPTDGYAPSTNSGWTSLLKNPSSGYYTWMTLVYIDGSGNYGSYMPAIRITGEKGSAGQDGSFYEYIYRRSNSKLTTPEKPANSLKDGFVPDGWYDHPNGIDEYNRYEYVCYRVKDQDSNQWGNWFGPYLWSSYGENGTNGDGVEYIYFVGIVKPTGNTLDPSNWDSSISDFQNDGYVLNGSGWSNTPIDLTELGLKLFVSVRKKKDDIWQAYSEPTLWSYYSVDGKSDSIMMRVDGENQYIPVNSDNTNKEFSTSIPIYMYNSADEISFSAEISSVNCSDGTAVDNTFASISTDNKTQLLINLSNGLLSFDGKYYIIKIIAKSSLSSLSATRVIYVNLFGVAKQSKDSETYSLKISSSVIKYEDGSFYPSSISCYVLKSVGNIVTLIYPSTYNSQWSFLYSVGSQNVVLSSNELILSNILSENSDGIQFVATNSNLGISLSENIPVVKSGIAGTNGVSYNILASDVTYSYSNSGSGYNINFSSQIKLSKLSGLNQEYLDLTSYYIKYSYSSSLKDTGITEDVTGKSRKIEFSDTILSNSSVVQIYAYGKETDAILAQLLIPVSASGKDGETPLTISGSPLRIVGEYTLGKKYYDGKRSAGESDGVFYQDVVLYDNLYYACINTEAGETDNWTTTPDKASYFSAFSLSSNEMADLLIANKAFVKLLSSNEVVIMDGDTIVAGMTSGSSVDSDSLLDGKISGKGNVRIWAGQPTSTGDLTTAPFTVSNTGVILSKGPNYTVRIEDGVIYFITLDATYHLGLNSQGEPDWVSSTSADTSVYLNKLSDGVQGISKSTVTLYVKGSTSTGTYYYDFKATNVYNGKLWEFYELVYILMEVANTSYIAAVPAIVYKLVQFTSGKKSYTGNMITLWNKTNVYMDNTNTIRVNMGDYIVAYLNSRGKSGTITADDFNEKTIILSGGNSYDFIKDSEEFYIPSGNYDLYFADTTKTTVDSGMFDLDTAKPVTIYDYDGNNYSLYTLS